MLDTTVTERGQRFLGWWPRTSLCDIACPNRASISVLRENPHIRAGLYKNLLKLVRLCWPNAYICSLTQLKDGDSQTWQMTYACLALQEIGPDDEVIQQSPLQYGNAVLFISI